MSEKGKIGSEKLENISGGQFDPSIMGSTWQCVDHSEFMGDPYDLSRGRMSMKRTCEKCGKEFEATRGDNEHMSSKHMNYCPECRGERS